MSEYNVLNIYLEDIEVGRITLFDGDRTVFVFSPEYIEHPDRPVLSQSFLTADKDLINEIKPRHMKLDPYFSNLLPEANLREYLARINDVDEACEFYLLRALGDDLTGAVKVASDKATLDEFDVPALFDHDTLDGEDVLHFSLAGVQLKFSASKVGGKGYVIPAKGRGGEWILKLPDTKYTGVPENEYSMMKIAKEIGIDVPKIELIDLDETSGIPNEFIPQGGKILAIRRFDRSNKGTRIHTEDFAQVYGVYPKEKYGKASYASIARVLKTRSSQDSIDEFIRRLTYSVLIGNADMHLKNWSLIYADGRTPEISPAYDFVSTIPYLRTDNKLALSLGSKKTFSNVDLDSYRKLAATVGLSENRTVLTVKETVSRFLEVYRSKKSTLDAETIVWESIDTHLADLPITKI